MSKGSYTSLTAGLLARKGEAVPATSSFNGENIISAHPPRRPLTSTSIPPGPSAWAKSGFVLSQHESQGPHQNESGEAPQSEADSEHARQAASAAPPTDTDSNAAHAEEDCDPCVPLAALATGDDGVGRRSSVTFRLNATRYLCLKMAAAKLGRTHQDILTAALDMYLKTLADDALSDCSCLQQLIKGDTHVNPS